MLTARRLLAAALLLGLLAVNPAQSLAATSPSLTVSPSTDLTQGQLIDITVSEDAELAKGLGQCAPGANLTSIFTAQSHCVLIGFVTNGGDVSTTWAVRRILAVTAGEFDCADGGCQVVYASAPSIFAEATHVVSVPLAFSDAPVVTVDDTTQILDGQEILVTVRGATGDATADLVQCVVEDSPQPDGAPGGCTDVGTTVRDGDVLSGFATAMRDLLDSTGAPTDCTRTQCALGARVESNGSTVYLTTDVVFRVSPITTFVPDRSLEDGQTISVSAVNVRRFDYGTTVVQCRFFFDLPIGNSDCGPTGALVDDVERSTYETQFTANRFFESGDGSVHDCGRQPPGYLCSYFLAGRLEPSPDAPFLLYSSELPFFRRIDPFEVTPATELGLADEVVVTIDDPTVTPSFLGVCPAMSGVETIADARVRCDGIDLSPHERGLAVERVVNRSFMTTARWVDCAREACEVVYLSAPTPEEVAPTIERRALGFAKTTNFGFVGGVTDGASIDIALVGYPGGPDVVAAVAQCGFRDSISYEEFFCRATEVSEAGFDGDLAGSWTVERFIETPSRPIDCVAVPWRCAVVTFVIGPDFTSLANPGRLLPVGPAS